jgi:hypothetical protein
LSIGDFWKKQKQDEELKIVYVTMYIFTSGIFSWQGPVGHRFISSRLAPTVAAT